MRFIALLPLFVILSTAAAEEAATQPASLSDLAAKADFVALAQVKDTDYFTRRNIPVSGSAYLKLLIPYKADRTVDIIEVYEKGLHDKECYFPNPSVFEEGRRYLLFLQRDPDDDNRYRGLAEGCALDVLVSSDNRYALRYPASGIRLSDPLGEVAFEMAFSDGYAIVDDEVLAPALRDAMLAAGQIVPYEPQDDSDNGRRWLYTSGISLSKVRELIGPEALEK